MGVAGRSLAGLTVSVGTTRVSINALDIGPKVNCSFFSGGDPVLRTVLRSDPLLTSTYEIMGRGGTGGG